MLVLSLPSVKFPGRKGELIVESACISGGVTRRVHVCCLGGDNLSPSAHVCLVQLRASGLRPGSWRRSTVTGQPATQRGAGSRYCGGGVACWGYGGEVFEPGEPWSQVRISRRVILLYQCRIPIS